MTSAIHHDISNYEKDNKPGWVYSGTGPGEKITATNTRNGRNHVPVNPGNLSKNYAPPPIIKISNFKIEKKIIP